MNPAVNQVGEVYSGRCVAREGLYPYCTITLYSETHLYALVGLGLFILGVFTRLVVGCRGFSHIAELLSSLRVPTMRDWVCEINDARYQKPQRSTEKTKRRYVYLRLLTRPRRNVVVPAFG